MLSYPLLLSPHLEYQRSTIVRIDGSGDYVFRRGHKNAGAAGFTPHTLINSTCLGMEEIAGIKCFVIDLQCAVKQMEFFNARMRVPRIIRSGIKPDQHAHAIVFDIPRQDLDVDTR